MSDGAPRRVASTDGVAVAVHPLHTADGGARLLIAHATGFNALAYGPLAAELGDSFDSVGVDVRGHGATTAPDGWAVDWHGFADDVVAAARAITTDPRAPLWGFGHSMGAAALLIAADRHPGLFAGLVLFEPIVFPPPGTGNNPLADAAARRRSEFDSLAAARANFAGKPPMSSFTDAALDGYLAGGLVADEQGRVHLTCRPEFEAQTYRTAPEHGTWDRLPEIAVPTVVIGTPPEPLNPPGTVAPLIADRLPAARFVARDDLDHFGPFVAPAAVAADVSAAIATFR